MDLLSTSRLFSDFLAQRRYLRNVTPSTIEWYETAFKALQRTHGAEPPLTRTALHAFVVDLRQRGIKPISCNTYIKALNAFCKWLHDEGHAPDRLQLQTLKLETRILQTLTDARIQTLLSPKPKTFDQWRLQALIALLLDTGVRIDEALTLRCLDVDYDNLLLTVFGKGRRAAGTAHLRLAPAAPHLRDQLPAPRRGHRALVAGPRAHADHDHQRYLHLLTEDLSASHQRVSILNRLG